jgi:hypothetical protein
MAQRIAKGLRELVPSGKIPTLESDLFQAKQAHSDVASADALYGKAIRSYATPSSGTAPALTIQASDVLLRKVIVAQAAPTLDQSTSVKSIPLCDGGVLCVRGTGATALVLPTRANLISGAKGDPKLASQPYVCWMFRIVNQTDNTVTITAPGTETTVDTTSTATGYNLLKVPSAPATAGQQSCGILVEIDNTAATPTCTYTIC